MVADNAGKYHRRDARGQRVGACLAILRGYRIYRRLTSFCLQQEIALDTVEAALDKPLAHPEPVRSSTRRRSRRMRLHLLDKADF
jgi:hypothetical protein